MLSTEIHKDLTKYKAKVIGGLTMRSMVTTVAAIGTAVTIALYSWFVLGLDFDSVSWAVYGSAILIWPLGFFHPLGMEIEEWLPYWWRHNFGASRLTYENKDRYLVSFEGEDALEPVERRVSESYRQLKRKQNALELWHPGEDLTDEM